MSHDNSPDRDNAHDEGGHEHHVVPLKTYYAIFGTLLLLTVITVAVSRFDLGPANMLVAMVVATIKASLVAMFFMQLRYDERLNAIVFVFGLVFVGLFFLFTTLDVFSRGYLDPRQDNLYMQQEAMRALRYEAEQKAGVPLPKLGMAVDTPPSDELVPPPPPSAPDAGVSADGGLAPAVGSAPGSEGAAPPSAPPSDAPVSAAPSLAPSAPALAPSH